MSDETNERLSGEELRTWIRAEMIFEEVRRTKRETARKEAFITNPREHAAWIYTGEVDPSRVVVSGRRAEDLMLALTEAAVDLEHDNVYPIPRGMVHTEISVVEGGDAEEVLDRGPEVVKPMPWYCGWVAASKGGVFSPEEIFGFYKLCIPGEYLFVSYTEDGRKARRLLSMEGMKCMSAPDNGDSEYFISPREIYRTPRGNSVIGAVDALIRSAPKKLIA